MLPQTSDELVQWSLILNNCLYGYVEYVSTQKSTIFGVKKENHLLYAIEIENGAIRQMYGRYNSKTEGTDHSSLVAWHKYHFGDAPLSQQDIL